MEVGEKGVCKVVGGAGCIVVGIRRVEGGDVRGGVMGLEGWGGGWGVWYVVGGGLGGVDGYVFFVEGIFGEERG